MQVLNWKMFLHPMNYLTILMMLVIAGIAGHELLSLLGVEPATAR
jgi:hypothetical protein